MSQTIELHLKAFDEASSTIASVNSTLTGSLTKIDDSTKQVTQSTNSMGDAYAKASSQTDEVNKAYGRVDESAKKTSMSFTQQVTAVNTLALSGLTLGLSFERVEKAQLASDKANLLVEKSFERVDQATKAVAAAITKYGEGSVQAIDAQEKLAIASESLTIAESRQEMVSTDLNNTYMQTALSIVPAVVGILTSLSAVKTMMLGTSAAEATSEGFLASVRTAGLGPTLAATAATWGLNSALLANPITWVVIAIVALGVALVAAYNYCKPFKDAVDALGAAIGQGLSQALTVVKGALEWLWNNILVPLGNFLIGAFMGAINVIGEKLGWLAGVLKPIGDAFGWLAGVIGGAINAVGKAIEDYNGMMKAAEESTKNGLSVMENFYRDKYDSMTAKVDEALSKQLETIIAKNQEAVDAENKAYEEDLTAFTGYWDKKLSITTSELQNVDKKITEFYDKQIADVQSTTQKQIDVLQSAYDKELTDFSAFWDIKFGVSNTELDKVQGAITSHYDQEISDTQASYETLIDEANAFYDGLQAVTDAGLAQLRASREADFDNMELLMLEEKVSLEQAHAAGLISDEEYQKQKTALSKTYNDERSVLTDSYRLQELQMEKENKDASTTIASEREAALTVIKTNEATAIAGIEVQKNADLQAAQQQYNQITQTDFQALTAAILSLKNSESSQVTAIERQKNADLSAASKQFIEVEKGHADELLRLQTEKANAIHDAEVKASTEKRAALDALEKQINADVTLSEAEKVAIIAAANADIQRDTNTSWGLIAGTIHASIADITSNLVTLGASVATAKAAAAGVQSAQNQVDAAGYLTPKQALINQLNAQIAVFEAAIKSGQYTAAQISGPLNATRQQLAAAQAMATGGIVYEPTLALIGEAGPEAVIPLNKFNSGELSNQTYVFSPSITITVAPGSVQNPRQMARDLLDEMNSLIRNDMKSKTFFTQG